MSYYSWQLMNYTEKIALLSVVGALMSVPGMMLHTTTQQYTPAISGFAFHNTSAKNALQILKDGYIRPFLKAISFTLDPCFTVKSYGVTFVFPEQVIRDKYGGKELFPRSHPAWESEMEVEVRDKPVYISDCVEILGGKDVCWKYGYGYKYRYVDIRDRKDWPWREFRR